MGKTIPANSPLLFSIEVADIEPSKNNLEEPKETPKNIDTSKF